MTTTQMVKFLSVDFDQEKLSKDGKPYKFVSLTIKGNGATEQKMIMNSVLNKAPDMKRVLEELSGGEDITLVLEQKANSKFSQIVGVHIGDVPDATSQVTEGNIYTPRAGGNTYQKKEFDTTGLQVGNALNNAATLIAHGAMKGTLEEVAEMVLTLGEKLKAKLSAGTYKYVDSKMNTATETMPKRKTVAFVEEDIPFGDD